MSRTKTIEQELCKYLTLGFQQLNLLIAEGIEWDNIKLEDLATVPLMKLQNITTKVLKDRAQWIDDGSKFKQLEDDNKTLYEYFRVMAGAADCGVCCLNSEIREIAMSKLSKETLEKMKKV